MHGWLQVTATETAVSETDIFASSTCYCDIMYECCLRSTEKLDSYGDDFRKTYPFQRHAVATNSFVSTRLRLEQFPVKTWRISLSLSSERDDGSVLFCIPACSPLEVRRFKRNVMGGLLLFARKPPSCWHDVHLYGHSWE